MEKETLDYNFEQIKKIVVNKITIVKNELICLILSHRLLKIGKATKIFKGLIRTKLAV